MSDVPDPFTAAVAAYRADRDRKVARGALPDPQLQPDDLDEVGMDECPFAPPEAYADERSGTAFITPMAEPRPRRFKSVAALAGQAAPEREWLVRDLIPSGTVTILGGDGGTGKSLLALMLAAAAAIGSKWLGRGVASGKTIYVSAEDDEDELHRRIDDVSSAYGVELRKLDRMSYLSLAGHDALLAAQIAPAAPLMPTAVFREIEAEMELQRPVLLVLDTLADLFPGNENDRAQARQFVGLLRGLAIRHQCAVLLLAHPSLSGLNSGSGSSGSTGWNNSVRSRLYLERVVQNAREHNPDARVLSTKKINYGRTGGEIAMTWKDGVFIADAAVTGLDRMAGNAKAERVFLKLLELFASQGRRVNTQGGRNYAPAEFSSHPDSEGLTKPAMKGAMETLLTKGLLRVSQDGPPSKRRHFLEVVK